jgi:hypothetical protein
MKLRVGLDYDDTLVTNTVIDDVLMKHGLYGVTRHYSIELMDIPQHVRDEIYRNFKDPKIMGNFLPAPGAVEFVKFIVENDCEPVMCTNRVMHTMFNVTVENINLHFPDIKLMHFTSGESKLPFLIQNNVDIMFDDSLHVIEDCYKGPSKMVIVSNEFTKHNHDYVSSKLPDNVSTVRRLTCGIPLIKEMLENI